MFLDGKSIIYLQSDHKKTQTTTKRWKRIRKRPLHYLCVNLLYVGVLGGRGMYVSSGLLPHNVPRTMSYFKLQIAVIYWYYLMSFFFINYAPSLIKSIYIYQINWWMPADTNKEVPCEVSQKLIQPLCKHDDFSTHILVSTSALLPQASLAVHQSENE